MRTSYRWTIPRSRFLAHPIAGPFPVTILCVVANSRADYFPLFFFKRVFLQRVQTLTLSPDANVAHWRLGFLETLGVGLYFDINLLYFLPITGPFPQISQTLDIKQLNN